MFSVLAQIPRAPTRVHYVTTRLNANSCGANGFVNQRVALTGATGFVGGYILRELLAAGRHVVVLARAGNASQAAQRVAAMLARSGGDAARVATHQVSVLASDLCQADLGLDRASMDCLRQCPTLVHAAACVEFESQSNGDPERTNLLGTQHLWQAVRGGRLRHWVQVSTAYVAGIQAGPVMEDALSPLTFRNAYESSKWRAEQFLRRAAADTLCGLSILRPGIVVGEHANGRTSNYQGFYRPLRLIAQLIRQQERRADGRCRLPLRLELDPAAEPNLVPVDWVARVISEVAGTARHGTVTYHLTPSRPATNHELVAAIGEHWRCDGLEFASGADQDNKTAAERWFCKGVAAVSPYWRDEPRFDQRHFEKAFPDLPCPIVEREAVRRMLQFAERDGWGRPALRSATGGFPCGDYLQRFLPTYAPQSLLPRINDLTVHVTFCLSGPGGGTWTCVLDQGEVVRVVPGRADDKQLTFAGSSEAFGRIVRGELSPPRAFMERAFEIEGPLETGLKLAMIFGQFVEEFPFQPTGDVCHAA
jgi:nucleoside-diphosphate-sugar epimerase